MSSTVVRSRIMHGEDLTGCVPAAVIEIIERENLYKFI
jgi:nicotinic acid mononucleotide adenylyltransferase